MSEFSDVDNWVAWCGVGCIAAVALYDIVVRPIMGYAKYCRQKACDGIDDKNFEVISSLNDWLKQESSYSDEEQIVCLLHAKAGYDFGVVPSIKEGIARHGCFWRNAIARGVMENLATRDIVYPYESIEGRASRDRAVARMVGDENSTENYWVQTYSLFSLFEVAPHRDLALMFGRLNGLEMEDMKKKTRVVDAYCALEQRVV